MPNAKTKPVILIVDDDKNTRDGLARALQDGYDVRLAESADRALGLLNEAPVDIVPDPREEAGLRA